MRLIALSVLALVAAVSVAGVYFAVLALPAAAAEFEREPEDLIGLVVALCLGLFIFGYCLSGIAQAKRRAHRIGLFGYAASAVGVLLSAALIVIGALDSVQRTENTVAGILVALCVAAYLYLGRSRNDQAESLA